MIAYFIRSMGAHFRSGRMLFLLTALGVALGVASVLSIQIINRNALGAFEGSLRAISGDADFSVVGRTPTLDEAAYAAVLTEPGVAAAWPMIRLDVALAGRPGEFLEVVALDLFAPVDLPWDVAPRGEIAPFQDGGWVAVSPELAERFGWSEGDRFDVTSGSRRVTLRVGARVDFRRVSPLASSRMLVMDVAQAQGLFGRRGKLHQIDVVAAEDAEIADLRSRLERKLGPTVRTATPQQREAEAADLLGAFRLNLTSLSLISLVVGGFLVYTSTQTSLVRRRTEFGLLRSLGATRLRVLSLILGEVLVLGILGTAVGIPLGYFAAASNVQVVSSTLSNLYLLQAIESLELPATLYLLAAAIGLGGACGGALFPAVEIVREDPRALLAAYSLHERARAGASRWFALGWATLGVTLLVWWTFLRDARSGGFVIGLGLLAAIPMFAPWVVRRTTSSLRMAGFGLRYGVKALGLKLQTTAFSVAALAVAVAMLVGVTVMISSFRRTVDIWLEATLKADIYVTTESWSRARDAAVLDEEIVREFDGLTGVRHVDRLRQFFVETRGRKIAMTAVDTTLPPSTGRFEMISGDRGEALRRAAEDGQALISEPLALKEKLGVGDLLTVAGPNGATSFEIAGVFYDYSSERGGAVIDLRTMERVFGPGPVSNVALYLEPGEDAEARAAELRVRFAGRPLLIRSNRDLRTEVFRIFDQTFAVTRLLQAMSLLIAVCGITLTLIVLARERVSELALYRALGASRRKIFRVFLGKGAGIACFGLLIGLPGGAALALTLVFLINRAWFGWTIAMHWPWLSLAQGAAAIVFAAVLASLYPALRASRTPATELSRENL